MDKGVDWYLELKKPFWAPETWVFGVVWTFLYTIILATYGFIVYKVVKRELPIHILIPFIINIVFNIIFTPVQFGLQNLWLAGFIILVVWATIIWTMIIIWPYYRWIALAQIPYLIWVSIATVLQWSIIFMNT